MTPISLAGETAKLPICPAGEMVELPISPLWGDVRQDEGARRPRRKKAARKHQPPKPSTIHTFPTIARTYQTTVTVSRTIFLILRCWPARHQEPAATGPGASFRGMIADTSKGIPFRFRPQCGRSRCERNFLKSVKRAHERRLAPNLDVRRPGYSRKLSSCSTTVGKTLGW